MQLYVKNSNDDVRVEHLNPSSAVPIPVQISVYLEQNRRNGHTPVAHWVEV